MKFGYARIAFRCEMCELEDRLLLDELIGQTSTFCQFCGADIDLTTDEWQERLAAAARDAQRPDRR